jgi:transposase
MAKKRLSMRKVREVLRLNHSGLSIRAIARACSIGREAVREYLCRASEAGLSWPLPDGLSDQALEQHLFPSVIKIYGKRSCPNWALIHQDLRKKGVTRKLLWREYKEEQKDPYGYSQFCELYRQWAKKLMPSMRMTHKAGEKLFVDYAGLTMAYRTPTQKLYQPKS